MVSLSQLLSISESTEVIPAYVTEDEKYLYIIANFDDNPDRNGLILKANLTESPPTYSVIHSKYRFASWQQIYLKRDNKLYCFGEFHDPSGVMRAGVIIVNLEDDSVEEVYHPNTGDCNEFIGAVYDGENDRFIVGERIKGGGTTGSNWPNGGGLWTIPRKTITDPSTWNRVHEFSPLGSETITPEVKWLAIFNGKVFAGLTGSSICRIAYASLDDLTAWTTLEDLDLKSAISVFGNRIAYISKDPSTSHALLKYSSDGVNWSTIDLGDTVSNLSDLSFPTILIDLYGNYAIIVAQNSGGAKVLLVDIANSSVYNVGTMSNPYCPPRPIVSRNDKVYIGNTAPTTGASSPGSPGLIYVLAFDTKRKVTLSLSKLNPAPGETITLEATLTDGVNPVANETVEFWIVKYKYKDNHYGEKIGEAVTDSNGKASITYTIPTNIKAGEKIVFRAVRM